MSIKYMTLKTCDCIMLQYLIKVAYLMGHFNKTRIKIIEETEKIVLFQLIATINDKINNFVIPTVIQCGH